MGIGRGHGTERAGDAIKARAQRAHDLSLAVALTGARGVAPEVASSAHIQVHKRVPAEAGMGEATDAPSAVHHSPSWCSDQLCAEPGGSECVSCDKMARMHSGTLWPHSDAAS